MEAQPRYVFQSLQYQRRENNIAGYEEPLIIMRYIVLDTYWQICIAQSQEIFSSTPFRVQEQVLKEFIEKCDDLNKEHDAYLAEIFDYSNG